MRVFSSKCCLVRLTKVQIWLLIVKNDVPTSFLPPRHHLYLLSPSSLHFSSSSIMGLFQPAAEKSHNTPLLGGYSTYSDVNLRQNKIHNHIEKEVLAVVTHLFVSIGMFCGIRYNLNSTNGGFNFRDLHKPFVHNLDYKSAVQTYYLLKNSWDQNTSWVLKI